MTLPEMHAAFLKAQGEFPAIPKGRTARMGGYSYTYADLGDILKAVAPTLRKHGFAIAQSVTSDRDRIGVQTRLLHESGEFIMGDYLYLGAGSTHQDAGSAITYARRYSLSALLGIATEDDADGAVSPVAADSLGHREATGDTPSKGYAVNPLNCDHKKSNGRDWVAWKTIQVDVTSVGDAEPKFITNEVCPKCGTPKVTAMEGTTQDLGSATGADSPGVHQP